MACREDYLKQAQTFADVSRELRRTKSLAETFEDWALRISKRPVGLKPTHRRILGKRSRGLFVTLIPLVALQC